MSIGTIAVVGAGNLGGRHLQALKNLGHPSALWIVDPNPAALSRVQQWYDAAAGDGAAPTAVTDMESLPPGLDVVVVATPSNVRREVVEQLLAKRDVRFLVLEKVLFQNAKDVRDVGELLERTGTAAWVNCPRRIWPFYADLQARLKGATGVGVHASGADWGLGCNGIHFLDLAAFLAGRPIAQLNGQFLEGVRPSKRPGYSEYHGTVWGHRGADSVVVTSSRGEAAGITVHVTSDRACAHVREADATAWVATAEGGWAWEEQRFDIPFQSQLTHHVVDQLLRDGTCGLTPYAESARLHELFLGALTPHHATVDPVTGLASCPIT